MLDVVTITCATENCREPIYMRREQLDQYKQSHATFRCHKGHQNYFPKGPSTADKLRQEIAQLKRQLEMKVKSHTHLLDEKRMIQGLLTRHLSREPGIHQVGNYEHIWVCTCGRTASKPNGSYQARVLLKAHQARMHCNPIPGLEVAA